MTSFSFLAVGDPISQGSKTNVRDKDGNVVGSRESNDRRLRPWRTVLTDAARAGHRRARIDGALDGPLEVWVDFHLRRPQARRWAIWAKAKPDIDKLQRALLDALKVAGTITDDARVVRVHAQKLLADVDDPWVGAHVKVAELADDRRYYVPSTQLELGPADDGAIDVPTGGRL